MVFVPERNEAVKPSIEEMAKGSFIVKNPNGILLTPPGIGLLSKIEKDFKVNFTKLRPSEVGDALPRFILDRLDLAKEMEISLEKNEVGIKIFDSIYGKLYRDDSYLAVVRVFGCPIVSAVACALAKSTGKFVTVQSITVEPEAGIAARLAVVEVGN